MNRQKRVILLVALLEAMFFAIFTMLYVNGAIKLVTFASVIITFSVIASTLLIIIIRKQQNS